MPSPKADLITHPVRAQILMLLMGRTLTTQQIAALIPDVPRASLYRHIRLLAEADILTVIEQIPVRGTLEKVYGVREGAAALDRADVVDASPADHLRYFTTLLESLAAEFRAYLGQRASHPNAGEATYNARPLYLTDAEYEEFMANMRALIAQASARSAAPSRRRRILAIITIPDLPDPSVG
jgi:hypothetical protein